MVPAAYQRMRTYVSAYQSSSLPCGDYQPLRLIILRFPLSFRDVEVMLAMRGVTLSYKTIREWCRKFGRAYAHGFAPHTPRPGDRWHLDKEFLTSMVVSIDSAAVDQDARCWASDPEPQR